MEIFKISKTNMQLTEEVIGLLIIISSKINDRKTISVSIANENFEFMQET